MLVQVAFLKDYAFGSGEVAKPGSVIPLSANEAEMLVNLGYAVYSWEFSEKMIEKAQTKEEFFIEESKVFPEEKKVKSYERKSSNRS